MNFWRVHLACGLARYTGVARPSGTQGLDAWCHTHPGVPNPNDDVTVMTLGLVANHSEQPTRVFFCREESQKNPTQSALQLLYMPVGVGCRARYLDTLQGMVPGYPHPPLVMPLAQYGLHWLPMTLQVSDSILSQSYLEMQENEPGAFCMQRKCTTTELKQKVMPLKSHLLSFPFSLLLTCATRPPPPHTHTQAFRIISGILHQSDVWFFCNTNKITFNCGDDGGGLVPVPPFPPPPIWPYARAKIGIPTREVLSLKASFLITKHNCQQAYVVVCSLPPSKTRVRLGDQPQV